MNVNNVARNSISKNQADKDLDSFLRQEGCMEPGVAWPIAQLESAVEEADAAVAALVHSGYSGFLVERTSNAAELLHSVLKMLAATN